MSPITNGVYMLKFVQESSTFERKVLVENGLYVFTDERAEPLPKSAWLSVDVALKSGDEFQRIDSVASEIVNWNCVQNSLPDEGTVVLLNVPQANDSVWPGVLDSGKWYWIDQSPVEFTVIAWSELPCGLPSKLYAETSGGGEPMSPIDVFNTLQQRFGRPLVLLFIDDESLIFSVPFWDNQEFDYGMWAPNEFKQRFPNRQYCQNFRSAWLADLAKGYVRDPEGNMRPPVQAA